MTEARMPQSWTEFRASLRRLRAMAGDPTFRSLAESSERSAANPSVPMRPFSHSTAQNYMDNRNTPVGTQWDPVRSVLICLLRHARQGELPVEPPLDDLVWWERGWQSLIDASAPRGRLPRRPDAPVATEPAGAWDRTPLDGSLLGVPWTELGFGPTGEPEHLGKLFVIIGLAEEVGAPQLACTSAELLERRARAELGPNHPTSLAARYAVALFARHVRAPAAALHLTGNVLDDCARALGEEHPLTRRAGLLRAELTWRCGWLQDARAEYARLIRTDTARYGARDRIVLSARRGGAMVARSRGDWFSARDMLADLVPDFRAVFGADDAATFETEGAYALAVGDTGEVRQARASLVELVERAAGGMRPDHPTVLALRRSLAALTWAAGDQAEAVRLAEAVAADGARALGAEHPGTLESLHLLAVLCTDTAPEQARRLFLDVAEAREHNLGRDHPDTLGARHGLALVLDWLEGPAAALRLLDEVLERQRRVLGSDHPSTLGTRHNRCLVIHELGDAEAAAAALERVHEDRERVLGADHPSTLATLHRLALSSWQSEGPEAARARLEDVLARQERAFERDHPAALETWHALAMVVRALEGPSVALPILSRVLDRQRATLGSDHRATLQTMHNLAVVTDESPDPRASLPLYEEVLRRQQALLGAGHPDTLRTALDLALATAGAHGLAAARPLFVDALELHRTHLGAADPGTLHAQDIFVERYGRDSA
ncbi:tetratricopeptide repeat protein [Embleya sp. NPDC050493]|uniref:tetratricopeptide repeat protein n=1 Tax=Embleya sp. NPDC050493 TaxID=3363989 RepID=UPI0037BBF7B0